MVDLQSLPAAPDHGPKSSLVPTIIAVMIVVICLVSIVVPLRLFSRWKTTKRFFLDDWLIIPAWILTIAVGGLSIAASNFALGVHIYDLDQATLVDTFKATIKLTISIHGTYTFAVGFAKLSIISSYLRIFSPFAGLRWTMYGAAVLTIALTLVTMPIIITTCRPINALWDFTIQGAVCSNPLPYFYAATAINLVTDLLLCSVPIVYVWKLHLPRKQKVLTSVICFIGGLAFVTSIYRMTLLGPLYDKWADTGYDDAKVTLLSACECLVGIICVSLPPIRPLLIKYMPNLLRSQYGTQSYKVSQPTVTTKVAVTWQNIGQKPGSLDEVKLFTGNTTWVELTDSNGELADSSGELADSGGATV